MNLFKDAAAYYKYRPEYPASVIEMIATKANADGSGNLLDVGCGTGSLCIPLSKYYEKVFAVDIDEGMIVEGKRNALAKGVQNIEWFNGDASELVGRFNGVQTVSFGCSLHWFDGPQMLKKVHDLLSDNGVVVVTGVYTIWHVAPELWQQKLLEIIKKYLGPQRMTLRGAYAFVGKPRGTKNYFADFLPDAGFKRAEVVEVQYPPRTLNVNEIIGLQYSTSYAAPELFKDKLKDFEDEVRSELLELCPSDSFIEKNKGFVTFGWKH